MAYQQRLVSSISLCLLLHLTCFSKTHLSLATRTTISPIKSITDIHDLLAQYGLPKGILPNVVKSYSLSDDGAFKVELERTCYVQFDQLVYYDKKISGKLSYGSVSDVSGIQAKKLFLWVSVTGMDLDSESGMIEFHVGALSEKLPAEQFQTIPTCKSKACLGTNPQSI